jgi:hypothetical protein
MRLLHRKSAKPKVDTVVVGGTTSTTTDGSISSPTTTTNQRGKSSKRTTAMVPPSPPRHQEKGRTKFAQGSTKKSTEWKSITAELHRRMQRYEPNCTYNVTRENSTGFEVVPPSTKEVLAQKAKLHCGPTTPSGHVSTNFNTKSPKSPHSQPTTSQSIGSTKFWADDESSRLTASGTRIVRVRVHKMSPRNPLESFSLPKTPTKSNVEDNPAPVGDLQHSDDDTILGNAGNAVLTPVQPEPASTNESTNTATFSLAGLLGFNPLGKPPPPAFSRVRPVDAKKLLDLDTPVTLNESCRSEGEGSVELSSRVDSSPAVAGASASKRLTQSGGQVLEETTSDGEDSRRKRHEEWLKVAIREIHAAKLGLPENAQTAENNAEQDELSDDDDDTRSISSIELLISCIGNCGEPDLADHLPPTSVEKTKNLLHKSSHNKMRSKRRRQRRKNKPIIHSNMT